MLMTPNERWKTYFTALKTDFIKIARLEFLQPDYSVAFALDNNPLNKRSGAFIQNGTMMCNLQNGQRRKANILLSNLDSAYDYNINKVWFGQLVRLMEGLILPNGEEFLLPQGVFYLSEPKENLFPKSRTAEFTLLDKWSYLDGTLFGNLPGTYQLAINDNIYTDIQNLLSADRGNGEQIDRLKPILSNYFIGKTVTLTDGTTVPRLNVPYTYRTDTTYADVALEMNTMLAGWIGYDQTGRLRLDPSQEDLTDANKEIMWAFTPTEREFLGATYAVKDTDVFNDVVVIGATLDNNAIARGRAVNMDPRSDTNIYGRLGRKIKRESAASYYANSQCEELAAYYLKRNTILKKSVSISSSQMFHLVENNLVTIRRPDKEGSPVERHLVTGFTRPIGQTGEMTINATSVADFPTATIVPVT